MITNNKCLFLAIFFSVASLLCKPKIVVITGGPSTGKTTLINALHEKGYTTVEEASTLVIKEEQANGNMEPWKNRDQFQLKIITKQGELLKTVLDSAHEPEVIFLDRAYPDGLAYYELDVLLPPDQLVDLSTSIKYDCIFVLDFLDKYSSDEIRHETPQEALKIHNLLINVYQKRLGYNIIKVPASSVDKRVEFVLENLGLSCKQSQAMPVSE